MHVVRMFTKMKGEEGRISVGTCMTVATVGGIGLRQVSSSISRAPRPPQAVLELAPGPHKNPRIPSIPPHIDPHPTNDARSRLSALPGRGRVLVLR